MVKTEQSQIEWRNKERKESKGKKVKVRKKNTERLCVLFQKINFCYGQQTKYNVPKHLKTNLDKVKE